MSSDGKQKRERDPIGSLVRVLDALAEFGDRPTGVRELARRLDLPPSTVQRTLDSARNASVVNATQDGKWTIGWEMFRVASSVTNLKPFLVCQDELDLLTERIGETTVLTVLDLEKNQRMFVAASESSRPVRFVPECYVWLPALAGATGLAIVANLAESDRRRIHEATPAGERTLRIRTIADLESTCERIRADGYALSENEVDLGACSVAVSVNLRADILCALGVIVPQQRFEPPDDAMLASIRRTASRIATKFGSRER
ncbi:IclR family transcriptional regulator [Phytoactinopolyspora endophytica]|uniref:IclR family transcriptional regulator n=1 Tax=Phytoactinopolyspora endophytica TaxID=1642495 RepID=UPI0013EB5C9D|nr:IclR family transcriptional regulator C-terminal domain-containing protein [Phytoactinopolyspora endophytica]